MRVAVARCRPLALGGLSFARAGARSGVACGFSWLKKPVHFRALQTASSSAVPAAATGTGTGASTSDVLSSVAASAPVPGGSGSKGGWFSELLWTGPDKIQDLLGFVHDTTGMPWWITIIAATCAIRLAVLPIFVAQQKRAASWKEKMPGMQKLMNEMKEARRVADSTKDPEAMQKALRKYREISAYRKENGIQMRFMFGPMFVQAPVFMSFFFALKHIPDKFPDIVNGGALWFTNLGTMDPYYILPAAAGAGLIAMGMLNTSDVGDMPNPFASSDDPEKAALTKKVMRTVMVTMGVVTPFFTYPFPAAVFVYWITNNIWTLIQSYLLRLRRFRLRLGIVDIVPSTHATATAAAVTSAAYKPPSQTWRAVPAQGFAPIRARPASPSPPSYANTAAAAASAHKAKAGAAGRYQPASASVIGGKKK